MISSGPARASVEFLLVRLHTDHDVLGIGETQAWRCGWTVSGLLANVIVVAEIRGNFGGAVENRLRCLAASTPNLEPFQRAH